MRRLTLVILAAGLGSRYGGLKQIEPVGTNKESIIDFSIYDAIAAGFKRVVLIIKPEHEEAFEQALVSKIRPFIEVAYAYQTLDDIPVKISIESDRVKPWGTTHATLSTRHIVDGPFAIINADDYYGKEAFVAMANFLSNEVNDKCFSMVGYRLKNTTTEYGSVTRAVCKSTNDYLDEIVEVQKITKQDSGYYFENEHSHWVSIDPNELVSMNFWGFHPSVYPLFTEIFANFLQTQVDKNPLKAEHVIPTAIGEAINQNEIMVKILPSQDQWYGITYKEDRQQVVDALRKMKELKKYPFDLWSQDAKKHQ
jgi:choline kinase